MAARAGINGGAKPLLRFADFHGDGLPVTLAALGEPFGQRRGQSRRLDAEASLDAAFAERQRVVKLGRSGKIAHAKAVEPFERARAPLVTYNNINVQLSGVDGERSITPATITPPPIALRGPEG